MLLDRVGDLEQRPLPLAGGGVPPPLERRRRETANAISTLFGVDRAMWSTQSTLLVYLSADEADPSGELCPLLERYPELAASRIQLAVVP